MTDSSRPPMPLGRFARQRVRLAGSGVPAWALAAMLALVGAGLGAAIAGRPHPPQRAATSAHPLGSSPAAKPPAASSSPPSASAQSLVVRARQGDLTALKQVERMDLATRPLDHSVALAAGHAKLKRDDLAALARDVTADPSLLDDVNTARMLHACLRDPEVALLAIELVAGIEHPTAADLLYDVWAEGGHASSADFAQDVLHHPSVRSRCSPALEVALALSEVRNCVKLRTLLRAAIEHADRRALPWLDRLRKQNSCPSSGGAGCTSCLGESDRSVLDDAIDKARKRPAPSPWTSRKVRSP